MLEKQQVDSEYEDLTNERFKEDFLDAWFIQWLLGLGEFALLEAADEGEASQPIKVTMWIVFLFATLIS